MGDINQNSRGLNVKGKQEKKGGKPSWWVIKAKKQSVKKKLKGKAEKRDSKDAPDDQMASKETNVLSKKENVGHAPLAGLNIGPGAAPMSKQARKRKLKRQAKLLKKLERKQKLQSKKTIKVAKEKDVDQTNRQLKKRKRRFRRKRQKGAEKAGKTDFIENETKVDVDSEEIRGNEEVRTSERKEAKYEEKKERKRKGEDDDFCEPVKKLQKREKEGKNTPQSGDKSHESDAVPDIDKNWKNLMKSINYQPLVKKKEVSKAKDSEPEIWFDDVDPELVEAENPAKMPLDQSSLHAVSRNPDTLTKNSESAGLTKYVGLDCEMVGIGADGKENMLARVSIVNQHGLCIYDKFVAPQEDVTNYRTKVTGINAQDLKNADSFSSVQAEVSKILKGRILVGHALQNDLKVLFLTHPKSMIRDTSTYQKFKGISKGKKPKLKKLCETFLKVPIQQGVHNSVQDAHAAMKLFMLHRIDWEKELHKQYVRKPKIKTTKRAEALISSDCKPTGGTDTS